MQMPEKIRTTFHYAMNELFASRYAKEHPVKERIWLLSERGNDARDNAYAFLKYLVKEHPEITPMYVISSDSADYDKVRRLCRTVEPGSKVHHALMHMAEALISTHDCGFTPDMVAYHHYYKHGIFLPKGVRVFLQHGIMDKDITWYYGEECKADVFIVSAEKEEEIVKSFGQPAENIVLTGLARYDTLSNDIEENMILVMPTWRQYLVNLTGEEFKRSDYYKFYDALLHSARIYDLLERSGYHMVFYPHIEMQKFNAFASDHPQIDVLDFKSADVQTLLKKAKVLVTDYSSVYFDAAYMGKDIVFTQFDKEMFEGGHYNKCLINYRRFGEVTKTVQGAEKAIEIALSYPGTKKDSQQEFFKYHDSKNCERIFEAIEQKIAERRGKLA